MFQLCDLNPLFRASGGGPNGLPSAVRGPRAERQPSETNFYRFALLRRVSYFVLQLASDPANETTPLNVFDYECMLRRELASRQLGSPILVVASGKDVWTFMLDVEEAHENDSAVSQLQTALETLEWPLKVVSVGNFTPASFVQKPNFAMYMNFFKAVRRHIFARMASDSPDGVVPFATQYLLRNSDDWAVLKMNPSITPRGELLVNFAVSQSPKLTRLSDLTPSDADERVVYIAPSGVRCYFALNGSCQDSLTEEPPRQLEKHTQLLRDHCDIDLEAIPGKWVRLVPNLKHLNSLTPNIASYLEKDMAKYGSSKYIVWPAALCFTQRAVGTEEPPFSPNYVDPFDLVEDFIQAEEETKKQEEVKEEVKADEVEVEDEPMEDDTRLWSEPGEPMDDTNAMDPVDLPTPNSKNEDDWDELFGDMEDEEVAPPSEARASSPALSIHLGEEASEPPKELDAPSFYEDPGAPAPLPLPIFASPNSEEARPETRGSTPTDRKSVFAPLNFNPVIEKNIDSKYLNGGKFFFESKTNSDTPATPQFSRFGDITPLLQEDNDSDLVSDSEYESAASESASESEEDEERSDSQPDSGVMGLGINHQSDSASSVPPLGGWAPSSQPPAGSPMPGDPVENQNWLPFLLRSIPTHTIPHCFTSHNPVLNASELDSVLPVLQQLFVFGWLNYVDGEAEMPRFSPQFRDLLASKFVPDEVDQLLRKSFPGAASLKLHEVLGGGSGHTKLFESLSGKDADEDQSMAEFDDPNFATTSPLFNMNTAPDTNVSQKEDTHILEAISPNTLFHIPPSMLNLKRMDQPLKINFSSLNFWNILNLQPLNGQADFRMVIVAPKINDFFVSQCQALFDALSLNYSSCKLGSIAALEAEGVSNGVLQVEVANTANEKTHWDAVRASLGVLAKSVQQSYLENSESNLPLLLLFPDPFGNISSAVEAGRTIAEFTELATTAVDSSAEKNALDKTKKKKKGSVTPKPVTLKLPIKVFQKVFPIDLCYSKDGGFSVCTSSVLTKVSLSLHSLCPSEDGMRSFTTISKDLPKKIGFRLTRTAIANSLISDDLFIHLAYERSIDKNWCVASWTDQYGSIKSMKAWHVPYEASKTKQASISFESVSNQIWDTTFSYVSSHSGRSYVLLTRLNNVIPDDELIEWKRLSQKHKGMSLVVLTVDTSSSFVLRGGNVYPDPVLSFSLGKTVGSTASMVTPFRTDSPEVYGTTPSEFQVASPGSVKPPSSGESSVEDITNEAFGFILTSALPLSNQPTRIPIKTGYLYNVFPVNDTKDRSSLEVNLLSCPQFVDGSELMKTILLQYRNLANLGDACGMERPHCKDGTLIPWHILAVRKTLNGLVHIKVT